MVLGGGLPPPRTPPLVSVFGLASSNGRILRVFGGGAAAPPHPPGLLGLRPRVQGFLGRLPAARIQGGFWAASRRPEFRKVFGPPPGGQNSRFLGRLPAAKSGVKFWVRFWVEKN